MASFLAFSVQSQFLLIVPSSLISTPSQQLLTSCPPYLTLSNFLLSFPHQAPPAICTPEAFPARDSHEFFLSAVPALPRTGKAIILYQCASVSPHTIYLCCRSLLIPPLCQAPQVLNCRDLADSGEERPGDKQWEPRWQKAGRGGYGNTEAGPKFHLA